MRNRVFFERVESLRAIGALLVAAYHFSGMGLHGILLLPHQPWPGIGELQNTLGRTLLALLPSHAALMMFFVVSGFVLRVSLENGPQERVRAAGRFLIARIFRFYPIVFFGTALSLLLFHMGFAVPWQPPNLRPTPETVIANLLLLDVSMNGIQWALQLELLMAPVIVLLYFLERRLGPRLLLGFAILTSALSFSGGWALWEPLSTKMFAFVVGMAIPTFGRHLVSGLTVDRAMNVVCAIILVLFAAHNLLGFYSRWNALVETYAAALLLSFAAYSPDVRLLSFLDLRPLRTLGRAAGSYYVLHLTLAAVMMPIVTALVPRVWMEQALAVAGAGVLILLLVAVAPVALLAHALIEAPGIELGRQVNYRVGFQRRRETPPIDPGPP